jgi:multimeric flavodoxin WrbA
MRILFMQAALRSNGTTAAVVEHAVQRLADHHAGVTATVHHLCETDLQICYACYACDAGEGACPNSGAVGALVTAMCDADAIVYAFPVHAFGTSSLMQVFLERAGVGYLRFRRPLEGKLAAIVVTGRRYAHEMAWAQVALNVMLNKMVLVGSGFPSVVRNDGKRHGGTIFDAEGLRAVEATMDRLVAFHARTRAVGAVSG